MYINTQPGFGMLLLSLAARHRCSSYILSPIFHARRRRRVHFITGQVNADASSLSPPPHSPRGWL